METIYFDKDQNISINRPTFVVALLMFVLSTILVKNTTINILVLISILCYLIDPFAFIKKYVYKNYVKISHHFIKVKLNNSKIYTIAKSNISNVRLIYNHTLVITTIDNNRFVFNVKNITKDNLEVLLKINHFKNS